MSQIIFPSNKEILNFLNKHKILNKDVLKKLESDVKVNQNSLGQRLFDLCLLKEEDFAWVSSQLLNLPMLKIDQIHLDYQLFQSLPIDLLLKYNFIPITLIEGEIIVGIVNLFEEGLDDILHLVFGESYRLNIIKESDFEKLIRKLDYNLPIDTFPALGFSDNLLNENDLINDDSCIALSYYLILSLFSGYDRTISLFPYKGSAEVRIQEGKKVLKSFILEKYQFFILLWRIKKIFGIMIHQSKNSVDIEKDFYYDKQHFRLKLTIFSSNHGDAGIISHTNAGVTITNSPSIILRNFELILKGVKLTDSGLCLGYNNFFSKLILLERIVENSTSDNEYVYLTSNPQRVPQINIPLIILDSQHFNFKCLTEEIFKIYNYIIIDEYDFSKHYHELESVKRFIILVSSIDYFTPINYLISFDNSQQWKLLGLSVIGVLFDTGDMDEIPVLVGDFYKMNFIKLLKESIDSYYDILNIQRNEFLNYIEKQIKLTGTSRDQIRYLLGVELNGD